jgi:hypothetical protein
VLKAATSSTLQAAALSMLSDAVLGDNAAQEFEFGYHESRLVVLQATTARFTLVPYLTGHSPITEVQKQLASSDLCHPLLAIHRWCQQLERRFLNLQVMQSSMQGEAGQLLGLDSNAVHHLYQQLRTLQLTLMKSEQSIGPSVASITNRCGTSRSQNLGSSAPLMCLHSLLASHIDEPDLPDSEADVKAFLDEVKLNLLPPSLERDLYRVVCFLNLNSLCLRHSRIDDEQLVTLMSTLTVTSLSLEHCTALRWLLKPEHQANWQQLAKLSLVDLSIRRFGARRSMFGPSLPELACLATLELQHLPLLKELGIKIQSGCEVLIASCPHLSNWIPSS